MRRDRPFEAEVEEAQQAALRAERVPQIIDALEKARSELALAPRSLRHADRFAQDLTLMIDAIAGQKGRV